MIKKGIHPVDLEKAIFDPALQRVCKKCHILKFLKDFPRKPSPKGLIYFQYRCRNCQYKVHIEKYENKLTGYNKKQRYRENFTINGRASLLRNRCKQRSKKNGMPFSISIEKVVELLSIGKCYRTGITLVLDDSVCNPFSPSIDRIDNNLGYTDENIQITCLIYNFCKNQFRDEDVENFINLSKSNKNDIHRT